MSQKFTHNSAEEQFNTLLTSAPYRHDNFRYSGRFQAWPNEFGSFQNDNVALQTFVQCLNAALKSNDCRSILMALGVNVSTNRYPHLIAAVRAFSSNKYQAAVHAAQLARDTSLNDTSLNRNFAFSAASLIIAHANEEIGDDTAVITALLNYKQRLEVELGHIAHQWFKDMLDSFYDKMGQIRFQNALIAYEQFALAS